jgi:hypothetical protein
LQEKVSKSGNSVTKKQLLLVKTALKSLGIILPSIKVFKNNKYMQLMANLGKCQFYCKKEMFFRMEHFSVPRPVCNGGQKNGRYTGATGVGIYRCINTRLYCIHFTAVLTSNFPLFFRGKGIFRKKNLNTG